MTVTMNPIETHPFQVGLRDADGVLDTLHDTLDAVADLDPDLLHSHTSAGHAVVALAAAARAAAASLGADPGTPLREAPGVVVVRDLVAAVSLLEHAASRGGGPPESRTLLEITRRAATAYGLLLLAVPAVT